MFLTDSLISSGDVKYTGSVQEVFSFIDSCVGRALVGWGVFWVGCVAQVLWGFVGGPGSRGL